MFCNLLTSIASCHSRAYWIKISRLGGAPTTRCAQVLVSKSASRQSRVQFSPLIPPDRSTPAALASLLFDLPERPNLEKNAAFVFAFSRALTFFLLFFSSPTFSLLSSHSLTLSLCCCICPYVGSLISKFPLAMSFFFLPETLEQHVPFCSPLVAGLPEAAEIPNQR